MSQFTEGVAGYARGQGEFARAIGLQTPQMTGRPQTPLEADLSLLHNTITALRNRINELGDRLARVTSPMPPVASALSNKADVQSGSGTCEACQSINQETENVRSAIAALDSLINRLEV